MHKAKKAPSIYTIVVNHVFDYPFHLETEASKRLVDRPLLGTLNDATKGTDAKTGSGAFFGAQGKKGS